MDMAIDRRQFGSRSLAALAAGLVPSSAGVVALGRAAAQGITSLTALWWDWKPWNEAATDIFARFRQKAGAEIRLNLTPMADLNRAARAIPQQRDKPDIVLVTADTFRGLMVLGMLRPLDDVFTAADLQDFLPVSRNRGTWKGKFYGPAMDEASQGLYYNREIIERYNIKPPTELAQAWTWSEARQIFIEVQAKERERRRTDRFWALNIGSFNATLGGGIFNGLVHIVSNGVPGSPTFKAISDDGLTTDGYLNSPEALEAFTFLQNLFQKDGILPLSTTTDFFPNEQVAFWHGNMSQRYYIQQVNPNLHWGATFVPYHKTPVIFTDSFMAGVVAGSANADLAARAVQHLADPGNGEMMARAARDLPLRRSSWERIAEYNEAPLDLFLTAHEKSGQSMALTPGGIELRTIYQPMHADICAGAPVKDTVQAAVEKIDAQLKRYASLIQ
jgi:fructooligosaccharide transport system substrate-binding protein